MKKQLKHKKYLNIYFIKFEGTIKQGVSNAINSYPNNSQSVDLLQINVNLIGKEIFCFLKLKFFYI